MPAIGSHSTATSRGAWDGPANERRLRADESAAYYRRAFAWVNPDGDPTTKAAYSFIHHEVSADGSIGAANLTACSTAIGVLNGGRTPAGSNRPWMADRAGIHRHLAAHMMAADMEPPPLRGYEPGALERREFAAELRVEQDADQAPRIEGYAAVFNKLSEPILGLFREQLEPGAFRKSLRGKPDVLALWNHDANHVLGRSTSKTLRLEEDDTGLRVQIEPPDATWANDLLTSMRRGDVRQMSFAFTVDPKKGERWDTDDDGQQIRTITQVDQLFDVSVVTRPAYPQTSAQVRSAFGVDWDEVYEAVCRGGLDEADQALLKAAHDALGGLLKAGDPELWRIHAAHRRRVLELTRLRFN